LTSFQISEWEAYDRVDPIGEWRADFRHAQLRSMITNITRTLYPKKGEEPKMTVPLDFMPDWIGSDKEETELTGQSIAEQKRVLMGIAGDQKRRVRKGNINLKPSKRGPPMKREI